jgi:hypothetical protein
MGRDMKLQGVLAALLIAVTGSAYATEYLQNGSFETGAFDGWTLADPLGLTFVQPTTFGFGAQNGNFYVYAGPPSALPGALSQTFADTAGEQLNISGWAIGDPAQGLGAVSYFFDNILLGSPDLSSGNWTPSTFQVTATGSDTFSIEYANDTFFNGLDNFSVVSAGVGSVPEPGTWMLLLLGFIGLGLLARTGRRARSRRASEVRLLG